MRVAETRRPRRLAFAVYSYFVRRKVGRGTRRRLRRYGSVVSRDSRKKQLKSRRAGIKIKSSVQVLSLETVSKCSSRIQIFREAFKQPNIATKKRKTYLILRFLRFVVSYYKYGATGRTCKEQGNNDSRKIRRLNCLATEKRFARQLFKKIKT